MTKRKLDEKVQKAHSGSLPGVVKLNTDQGMGHYEWGKKVAGHDGKKQTSPNPSMGAFKDSPVAVGYTKAETKMAKAAAGGKTSSMTASGSKESSDTHTKSPVRQYKESTLREFGNDAAQDPNAVPAEAPPANAAPGPEAGPAPTTPTAPASTVDANTLLDKLPEIVSHVKERQTLDPNYNSKAAAADVAEALGVEANDPTIAKILKFLTVQYKLKESYRDQVRGNEHAKDISPVLGKKAKKHPFGGRLVGEDEELSAGEDTVTLDVPLMIRVMEYAKEDAKTDMELHKAVERMLAIGGALTMNDYDSIVSNLDEDAMVESRRQRIRKTIAMKESFNTVRSEFAESKRLDELKAETLKSYKRASAGDAINRRNDVNINRKEEDSKIAKRNAGQERAEQKLQAKEKDVKESFAQFKAGKL
jgi:hypothetical protein